MSQPTKIVVGTVVISAVLALAFSVHMLLLA